MTVASETRSVEYNGNGATTVFPYSFRIFAQTDLRVTMIDADDEATVQTLGVDYTVSGANNPNGGNVTMVTAPASGERLLIEIRLPLLQPTDIKNQGAFFPQIHEDEFDRLVRQLQQVNADAQDSLRHPTGFSNRWDAQGYRILNVGDGVDAGDAINKGQLEASVTAAATGATRRVWTFTGDGATTDFSIPGRTMSSPVSFDVYISGVRQAPVTDYGIDAANNQIEFTSAPPITPSNEILVVEAGFAPSSATADQLRADLASSLGSALLGFLQDGAGAVQRTAQSEMRETIKSTQYATLQQAVNAAENKRLLIIGNYTITAAVTLPSNIVIDFDASATITTNTPDIDHFYATGKTNITVRGGKFVSTVVGTVAYVGGVTLDSCTNCNVEYNTFTGMQWTGVYLNNSSKCIVRGNRINPHLSDLFDSSDISVYGDACDNLIEGNYCYGLSKYGVQVQDPYSLTAPLRNRVLNNWINGSKGYGVIVYQPFAQNTYTVVDGNHIENIQGTHVAGVTGAGIYVVAAGGCIITNNTIKDCCLQTTTETLAPGGIGVNGIDEPLEPTLIANNTITNGSKYAGIYYVNSTAGGVISGNNIQVLTGATQQRGSVYVKDANNVEVVGNRSSIATTVVSTGVFVHAVVRDQSNVSVQNNQCRGGNLRGIFASRAAAFRISNLNVSGNTCTGGGAASIPFDIQQSDGVVFDGNTGVASTLRALSVTGCTQFRGGSNRLITNGGGTVESVATSGTCTDSFLDASNYLNARTLNAGTGCIIERYGTAAPTVGTQAVGDRTINSVPTVGQPKAWVTTVAGSPGTQVSEGNL